MKQIFTFFLFIFTAAVMKAAPGAPFTAPTTPATNLIASGIDGDRISISWINGNGSKRIVIAKKDGPVTAVPVDGIDYNASINFGNGNEIAPGEFVILNGTASSVTVTSLQAAGTYHFAIYEFNGTGSGIQYLATPSRANATTFTAPAGQVTNPVADNTTGHSMRLNWTTAGVASLGSGRIVLAREGAPVNVNPLDLTNYIASTTFGSGAQIGSGNYVMYKGNGIQTNIDALKPGTIYYFSIFEYNGVSGLVFNINNPATISVSTLPRPSLATSNINFQSIEGNSMSLTLAAGNGSKRIIIAKAGSPVTAAPQDGSVYTASSIFGSGQQLAAGEFVIANGTSTTMTLSGLSPAITYYFAVFEYDGTATGTTYLTSVFYLASKATVSAPATPASNLTVSSITNSSFTLNWANGDGAKRLVVVRSGSPINSLPVNLTSYAPSTNFSLGNQVGAGYAVYANTGNTVTVNGLSGGITYYIAVFEYNGSGAPVYLTDNYPTASASTSLAPTSPSTNMSFANIEGNKMTVNWFNGNGTKRIVIAKAGSPVTVLPIDNTTYTANASFGNGQEIAAGEFVVMNGSSSSLSMTNLLPGVVYYFAVFEYNSINSFNYYLTSSFATGNQAPVSAPTVNSSALVVSNVTGNSMKISFTKGNGSGRIIVVKAGSAVDAAPANFSTYSNLSTFGSGSQLGTGNYVVYNGNSNNVTVLGLQPDVTYHFQVFEFNGTNSPVYLTGNVLTGSQLTNQRPSVIASGINFYQVEGNKMTVRWTNGNGAKRILIGKAGSPVTAVPADGLTYAANTNFGSGNEIAAGEFVLSDNTSTETAVTNLIPSTTYYFAVFEYDGTGANTRYAVTALQGNGPTLSTPLQQATNVLFSSIGSTTLSVNWTNGDGDRHLVVLRKGAPVNAVLQNTHVYPSSTGNFTASNLISGENYAVYTSASNNVSLVNLTPGTTYYFAVYDYNGFSGPVYNMNNPATGLVTTLGPPTDPATTVQFSNAGNGTSIKINWLNGTGQKRLVLVKQGSVVDALPANNVLYDANSFFGSGQQLGAGNYAVYSGAADNVTINNLIPGASYHVAVFEYNQFATGPTYLTSNPATALFAGSPLPVQLISFSGVVNATTNVLTWKTASESNSKKFVIERSVNGVDYTELGEVTARGNSTSEQTYSFSDANRIPVAYYRLHIVDAEGKAEHSRVIRLEVAAKEKTGLQVYPIVAPSAVTVTIQHTKKEEATLQLIDMNGTIVKQEARQVDKGVNQFNVDLSGLIKGNYLLRVLINDQSLVQKIIKQ
jgi:hypothetical protein